MVLEEATPRRRTAEVLLLLLKVIIIITAVKVVDTTIRTLLDRLNPLFGRSSHEIHLVWKKNNVKTDRLDTVLVVGDNSTNAVPMINNNNNIRIIVIFMEEGMAMVLVVVAAAAAMSTGILIRIIRITRLNHRRRCFRDVISHPFQKTVKVVCHLTTSCVVTAVMESVHLLPFGFHPVLCGEERK